MLRLLLCYCMIVSRIWPTFLRSHYNITGLTLRYGCLGKSTHPMLLYKTPNTELGLSFLPPPNTSLFFAHALEFDHASSYAAARQIAFLRENWPLACHFEDKTLVNWPFIWRRMLLILHLIIGLLRWRELKLISCNSQKGKKGSCQVIICTRVLVLHHVCRRDNHL